MNAWILLWAAVLVVALALFSCLTVAVTIGGFLDIRAMLRRVARQHQPQGRPSTDGDDP